MLANKAFERMVALLWLLYEVTPLAFSLSGVGVRVAPREGSVIRPERCPSGLVPQKTKSTCICYWCLGCLSVTGSAPTARRLFGARGQSL
ncbi:hypothetical protein PROFUN_03016 [Planoprotostelium fungivorum]|uniref:Secreted protein n=1 Tax=Planoprotostelium fungivorum TaxID=1890364 RepID=A0A2P6NXB4_9EUKA|nr:hypothetical protein PROFUN_03016 [Planoprotostelium fungivorum]